jgi:hypothetical protein
MNQAGGTATPRAATVAPWLHSLASIKKLIIGTCTQAGFR